MKKRQLDEDGNEQREVRLSFYCTMSVPPNTPEDQLIDLFGDNGFTWSPLLELVNWGYR